jgi:DnaK suppressor protein
MTRELEDEETRALRADLEALRDQLCGFLEVSRDGSRPVELEESIGRLSRMDALQQQSMAKANRTAAEQRLERVEAALRRVAADEYGPCLRCDEPVGFQRLKAQPEAVLCIACQSRRERSA